MAISLHEFLTSVQAQTVGQAYHKWKGLCRSHDDTRHSLRIELAQSGKLLIHCDVCRGQGKSKGDVLQAFTSAGLWPVDVGNGQPVRIALSSAKASAKRRELEDVGDWVPEPTTEMPKPWNYVGMTVAAVHVYKTTSGKVSGSVIRYHHDTVNEYGKHDKEFRPLFCFMVNGKEQWRSRAPKPKPLYGLEKLVARDKSVLLVEGEKTADAAQAIFPRLIVLSAFGGLNGFPRNDISPLIGRDVIIWPDADTNWRSQLAAWINKFAPEGHLVVKSLRTITLDATLPNKWDLADPIPEGIDIAKMLANATLYEHTPDSIAQIKTLAQLEAGLYQVIDQSNTRFVWNPTKVELLPATFDSEFNFLRNDMGGIRPSQWASNWARQNGRKCIGKAYEPTNEVMIRLDGEMAYNTYLDPKIPSIPGDVLIWVDFLKFLLGDEAAHLFNCPLANLMQYGQVHARKCRYATILVGQQGIGKSIGLSVYEKLVGASNVSKPTTAEIEDRFNAYAGNVQVVNLVELAGSSQAYHRLMDVIADPEVRIHRKNLEPRTMKNYCVVIGSSNEDVPIKIADETERRWLFLKCKATVADRELFPYRDVIDWIDSHLPQLKYFYQNYDMKSWDPGLLPAYALEVKREMVMASLPPWELDYMMALRGNYFPLDRDVFTKMQFTALVGDRFKIRSEKQIIKKYGGGFLKAFIVRGRAGRTEELYVVRNLQTYSLMSPEQLGQLISKLSGENT